MDMSRNHDAQQPCLPARLPACLPAFPRSPLPTPLLLALACAVKPKRGTHGPQVAIYDLCLQRWGAAHTFMAFIDADEFIMLRDGTPNLPTLVSCVCARSAVFMYSWGSLQACGALVGIALLSQSLGAHLCTATWCRNIAITVAKVSWVGCLAGRLLPMAKLLVVRAALIRLPTCLPRSSRTMRTMGAWW